MTKSFSLSVLVPALSGIASSVPLAIWLAFDTTGRQGTSVLPVLFLSVLLPLALARSFDRKPNARLGGALIFSIWHVTLWAVCLGDTPAKTLSGAYVFVLSEWIYTAHSALLIGIAALLSSLALMMSASPVRGPKD